MSKKSKGRDKTIKFIVEFFALFIVYSLYTYIFSQIVISEHINCLYKYNMRISCQTYDFLISAIFSLWVTLLIMDYSIREEYEKSR